MFDVLWKLAAERSLAAIWTDAADRQSIADAARSVDQILSASPLSAGESRTGNQRIIFQRPLGVVFDVNEPDRVVSVLRVYRFRSKDNR